MQDAELTYSELLYLVADRYVPEASLLQNKEELPTGRKVSIAKLGNLVAEAAFAYLYFNDLIELKLETKKLLGLISKKVVVATRKSTDAKLTSLEKSIFDLSSGLDVHSILYGLIGEECPVPWSVVTGVVKEALVTKEFLVKEQITKKVIVSFVTYKYHFNTSKHVVIDNKLAELNLKLKEFSQKDFYPILVKAIESGIKAQIERSDSDD